MRLHAMLVLLSACALVASGDASAGGPPEAPNPPARTASATAEAILRPIDDANYASLRAELAQRPVEEALRVLDAIRSLRSGTAHGEEHQTGQALSRLRGLALA